MIASGLSFIEALMKASSCFSFFGKLAGAIKSEPSSSSRTTIELPRLSSFLVAHSLGRESMKVEPPVTWSLRCSSLIFSGCLVTLDADLLYGVHQYIRYVYIEYSFYWGVLYKKYGLF